MIIERTSSEQTDFPNAKNIRSCEAGISEFFIKHMSLCASLLQKHFPEHWQTVIALAYNWLVYKAPIKDTLVFWETSYLSEFYKDLPVDEEGFLEALEEIGQNHTRTLGYCKEFKCTSQRVMFVGTGLKSTSDRKDKVYCNDGNVQGSESDNETSTIWVFSLPEFIPIYYRDLPCPIKDATSLEISMKESGNYDCLCIVDKAVATKRNLAQLQKYCIKFIAPLSIEDDKCDYSSIGQRNSSLYEGRFRYKGKTIWYGKGTEDGVFRDVVEDLKMPQRDEFLDPIDEAREKEATTHEEKAGHTLTIEGLGKGRHKFGTLVLYTNVSGLSAKDVYLKYQVASALKPITDEFDQIPQCKTSRLNDKAVKEGWSLVRLLTLQWYCEILRSLSKDGSWDIESVNSAIKILTNVRRIRIGDKWLRSEPTTREQELLRSLQLVID